MTVIQRLIEGYRHFFREYFASDNTTYKELAEHGQSPKALIIACSDSRVDPSIITKAEPGEIFVIRNVASLVPPYQLDSAYHGTSSAVEFAVTHLHVSHIIVLGHTECAGIRALMATGDEEETGKSFIHAWVKIAEKARKTVLSQHKHLPARAQAHHCEEEAIKISLHNLLTFPWINEKVQNGTLSLHGWHFDVISGQLCTYNEASGSFEPVEAGEVLGV